MVLESGLESVEETLGVYLRIRAKRATFRQVPYHQCGPLA